ncbi:MAG: alanine dehydrogenase [Bacteroidales bacterium]|nr:alanine dehydrogenase [Bacteroidales bacterium]
MGKTISDKLRVTELMPHEEILAVKKDSKKFIIGIPIDEDKEENRVALTPYMVDLLVNNGHEVLIQSNAGKKANFLDIEYSDVGAQIVKDKETIFNNSNIIVKISAPTEKEIDLIRENQIIMSILHVRTKSKNYFQQLMSKKVTCVAYEYLKDENDCYPIVRSMSEIAGSTSILIAAEYLSNVHNGKGTMLGGITGVNPTEVVILGAGTAGEYAARTALGLGAIVKVFDTSTYKLKRLQTNLGQRVYTSIIHPVILANAIKKADVVIGAIRLIEDTPKFYVTEEMVKMMKKGSVIIDISIDQGGCIETSKMTSHSNPVYEKHGVIHYCVPNIPSRVARTASYAISNILTPILIEIGKYGSLTHYAKNIIGFRNGIYIYNGILTNHYISKLYDIPYRPIDLLITAF